MAVTKTLLEGAWWFAGRQKSYVFKVWCHQYFWKSVLWDSKGIIYMEMPCLETCLNLSDITPWEAVHKEVLLLWYSPVKAPEVWGNLLACGNRWPQGSEGPGACPSRSGHGRSCLCNWGWLLQISHTGAYRNAAASGTHSLLFT